MSRRKKILMIGGGILLGVWFLAGYIGATIMLMPKNRDFEDITEMAGNPVEAVALETKDGIHLSAWHVQTGSDKAVLFAHGIGSDRRQGKRIAEQYALRGYDVLMLDARGHGKSEPGMCTVGWNERYDLLAAYDWLKEKGYKTIGAHGISMGAATIAYSLQEDVHYDFVVLESSYASIDSALRNRLDMFHVPMGITYPFRVICAWKIGAGPAQMRPVDFMNRLKMPVLIVAGDAEPELKVAETQSLFDACASDHKLVHFFTGAKHEVFIRRYAQEYIGQFNAFLDGVEEDQVDPKPVIANAA